MQHTPGEDDNTATNVVCNGSADTLDDVISSNATAVLELVAVNVTTS